ncbi:MAG TPA: hypothetical protein VGO92_00695 [Acidimicrobiales bacterium]|nr:hypothetical protein [Acidimicrobiales bacterium]
MTGDGPPRSATITCGQPNRGTGYLGGKLEHASSACVTALISWPAIHFLDDGKLPSKKECRPRGTAPAGAVATLKGPWDGPYINRRIQTGRSRCEDALWTFLLPVLSPQEDEVVLFEAQLKAGNNGLPLATSTSTTTTTTTTSTSTP